MSIDITKLQLEIANPENHSWVTINDDGQILPAAGSMAGNVQNGWKIHISIDPARVVEAAALIAKELNKENAPKVHIKFATSQLALSPLSQPGKEIAFVFHSEELHNKPKITHFLNQIELALNERNIGPDQRPINSDTESATYKYDAAIFNTHGKPTRFNYRNDYCVVLEDETFLQLGGKDNVTPIGNQFYIRQSYYLSLPNAEKHNPGNQYSDPFAEIRLLSQTQNKEEQPYYFQEYRFFPMDSSPRPDTSNAASSSQQPAFLTQWNTFTDEFKAYVSEYSKSTRIEFSGINTEEYWSMITAEQQLNWISEFGAESGLTPG